MCFHLNREISKMTKIKKNKPSSDRVKLFRGIKSIMKQDEASLVNTVQLKKILETSSLASSNSDKNGDKQTEPPNLSKELRSWVINYNVKHTAVSALLKILISFGLTSIPKDARALMKTPRTVRTENVSQGQYWHNGLLNCLQKIFVGLASNLTIELNINIDGLPLFKSSPTEFWPILANIHGLYI